MAVSTLRKFLHDLITDELGATVVWANQNYPKLTKPFATLWLYGSKEKACAESRPRLTTEGNRRVVTPTEAVLEVQLYGVKGTFPYEDLERLVGRLSVDSVINRCLAAGVSFFDSESVQDDKQTYECRAAVDLRIRYMKVLDDDSTDIEQVEVTGSYDNGTMPANTFMIGG